jgi:predicted O-linked N-acetylglucosamine transferase (SPINDLY family)
MKLGVEAHGSGNLPKAQGHYNQALRLDPRHALATQNLAIVFAQSNLLNEALVTIERASMMDGVHGVIKMNWALMALESEQLDLALTVAQQGVDIAPNAQTRMALAMALTTAGMPERAIPLYAEILKEDPKHPSAGPNVCFIQTLTTATPKDLLAQRRLWHAANAYTGTIALHANDRTLTRPLRVGYVGGDFKTHSAAMIFGAVLQHHSAAIVPYFYSTLPVNAEQDMSTKAFQAVAGDRWRDLVPLTDEQADALIRKDQIDLLVDLAGHTNGGRLTLFTRKPAPVQVTAWGFAHGTGCPEIDYFLADPIAIPQAERADYAEQILDLPCIVSYAPPLYDVKHTSQLPFHKNGYLTFGTYARYEKMSETCLRTFADILRRVPESRLEFKDHGCRRPSSIRRIQALMPDLAKERLLFSIATSHQEHLQAYQQADLVLDPFPHGGGVVSLEQLYMGVPMVTLYGTQPSGRTASSVLTVMGKTDWIAKTTEEYIEKAVALVSDIPALGKIRKTLSAEFLASPVCTGYPQAVEAAYRTIWETWCRK